jgi:hypothetical protein
MMNPELLLRLAKAKEADLDRRSHGSGAVLPAVRLARRARPRLHAIEAPPTSGLLLARACELLRLAERLGYSRADLVGVIEGLG